MPRAAIPLVSIVLFKKPGLCYNQFSLVIGVTEFTIHTHYFWILIACYTFLSWYTTNFKFRNLLTPFGDLSADYSSTLLLPFTFRLFFLFFFRVFITFLFYLLGLTLYAFSPCTLETFLNRA